MTEIRFGKWFRGTLIGIAIFSINMLFVQAGEAPTTIDKITANIGSNSVRLNWGVPLTPENYPITDYIIQYKEQTQGKYTTAQDGKSSQTGYLLKNLNPNTAYNVRIIAVNSKGMSGYKVFRFVTKKTPTPGVCGPSNSQTITSFPFSSSLCKTGTANIIDKVGSDGTYNWVCKGINSSISVNCQANITPSTVGGATQFMPKILSATPYEYTGDAGKKIEVQLFWEFFTDRDKDYTQFMHLENGTDTYSVDDHAFLYLWSNKKISDLRSVTIPPNISPGIYYILVGLSGINEAGTWINYPLLQGTGVVNAGDNRYKVGVLRVGNTPIESTTYTWSSTAWGSCSATCGGGTQIRILTCMSNDGMQVSDTFCANIAKPVVSQACNIQACSTISTPITQPPPTSNTVTTVLLASPQTYNGVAGTTETINLNWIRVPLDAKYLQFMHLDNGTSSFSVDDHSVDSTNWSGNAVDTRTVTLPSTIPVGKYDILVGLSGGNPWQNIALKPGNGVTNVGNNRYKVGTINITGGASAQIPTPIPPVNGTGSAAGPRITTFVNSGPIRATNGQIISGLRISSTNGPCVIISGVSNVIVRDNDFTQCGSNADGTAVRIDGGSNNTLVEHNRISGNIGEGITVKYSPGNTVRKNVFAGIRDYGEKYRHGIEISWSDRTTVTDNIFGEGTYPSDILSGYEISDSIFTGNEFINVSIIEPTGASFTIGDASDLDGTPANPGSNNYVARNMVRSQYGGVPAGVFGSTSNTILENNCFSVGVQAYNYSGIFNGVILRNNVINQGRSFYGGDSGKRDIASIGGFDTNIDSTDCSLVP